ncbi:hypothetical protein ACFTZM_38735, partial [Streptomyces hydrogenans]
APETARETADETPAGDEGSGIQLPRRRRGRTLAAHQEAGKTPAEPARPAAPRTGEAARARFGGFQSGLRGTGTPSGEPPAAGPDASAPPAAEPTTPSSNHPHSEGNPR